MPTRAVRLATPDDAAAFAAIYRPAVEGVASFERTPPTAAAMAARVRRTLERLPWLACEIDGAVAGYAYASSHREREAYVWTAEVSAYVDAAYHRQGVGRALYGSLAALLGAQGLRTLVAGVSLPNPASVAFHRSMGFEPLGVFHRVGFKHGRAVDVAWFERHLSLTAPAGDPVPLSSLGPVVIDACLRDGRRPSRGPTTTETA